MKPRARLAGDAATVQLAVPIPPGSGGIFGTPAARKRLNNMARPEGFEPPTYGSGGRPFDYRSLISTIVRRRLK